MYIHDVYSHIEILYLTACLTPCGVIYIPVYIINTWQGALVGHLKSGMGRIYRHHMCPREHMELHIHCYEITGYMKAQDCQHRTNEGTHFQGTAGPLVISFTTPTVCAYTCILCTCIMYMSLIKRMWWYVYSSFLDRSSCTLFLRTCLHNNYGVLTLP